MRIDPGSTPVTACSALSSGVTVGTARASRLDVAIATRDGDTITISASRTTATGFVASSASGQVRASLVESTSSSVEIRIDGTLEHDELVDLKKVLKALDHAACRRDAAQLLRRLTRPDLDTVTSIEATSETSNAAVLGA
jgi:hypothetical protein